MKGADLIQIAAAVYGIRWFDELLVTLQIEPDELSALTKADSLPGPVAYAMRDIATKYMARVESMQLNTKIQDALMNGEVESLEQAAFMSGMSKGMALLLAAVHGEPDELKKIAHSEELSKKVAEFFG
jgi:uncharacterized protein YunC (DUF1805 family)